jgi:thiol-disulfide isomerase/thioredoxin
MISILIAMLAVAAIAYFTTRDGSEPSSPAKSSRPAKASTIPHFTAELIDGSPFASSEIEGPAVIHVFASWCPTCNQGAPTFAGFQQAHDELNWYYIDVADAPAAARDYLEKYHMRDDVPMINDPDREIEGKFGLTGQPHTLFVDARGNIVGKVAGNAGRSTYEDGAAETV